MQSMQSVTSQNQVEYKDYIIESEIISCRKGGRFNLSNC